MQMGVYVHNPLTNRCRKMCQPGERKGRMNSMGQCIYDDERSARRSSRQRHPTTTTATYQYGQHGMMVLRLEISRSGETRVIQAHLPYMPSMTNKPHRPAARRQSREQTVSEGIQLNGRRTLHQPRRKLFTLRPKVSVARVGGAPSTVTSTKSPPPPPACGSSTPPGRALAQLSSSQACCCCRVST